MYRGTAGRPFQKHLWTGTGKDTTLKCWLRRFVSVTTAFHYLCVFKLCAFKGKCCLKQPLCSIPPPSSEPLLPLSQFYKIHLSALAVVFSGQSSDPLMTSAPWSCLQRPVCSIDGDRQQRRRQVPFSAHLHLASVHLHLRTKRAAASAALAPGSLSMEMLQTE